MRQLYYYSFYNILNNTLEDLTFFQILSSKWRKKKQNMLIKSAHLKLRTFFGLQDKI